MAKTVKEIASRIYLKHDVEANWNKATTFIPQKGEIIIYDRDDNLDNEEIRGNYSYARFKMGDGVTPAIDLPFYLEEELDSILNKIDYLADNMLDATWQNGVLLLEKGIIIP